MKTHSYCRECKYLCFILAAAACTDLKPLLKINLAGVIPQNRCCSHENNICANFLMSTGQVRVRIFAGKKVEGRAMTLQVRLTLGLNIRRLPGKRNSMLTFEPRQTCSEVASACEHFLFVYWSELLKNVPAASVKWAAGSPPLARAYNRNLEVSTVVWKMKYTKRMAAGWGCKVWRWKFSQLLIYQE